MANTRIIARLDVKGPNIIKGIHLEGLRAMGDLQLFAGEYYRSGIDELIYMDVVASLYVRNNLFDIVQYTVRNIFIPFTVGGGIRSCNDVEALLNAGAGKVAVNTAAIKNPAIIKEVSERFGSQCMVLSIEAKRKSDGCREAYYDNGREPSGRDVVEWAKQGEQLGAGGILLISIDMEGTGRGFGIELVRTVSSSVSIPVIASGGMGHLKHLWDVCYLGPADAVAIADMLHYKRAVVPEIKKFAVENCIDVKGLKAQNGSELYLRVYPRMHAHILFILIRLSLKMRGLGLQILKITAEEYRLRLETEIFMAASFILKRVERLAFRLSVTF